jgi:hypothetical protein
MTLIINDVKYRFEDFIDKVVCNVTGWEILEEIDLISQRRDTGDCRLRDEADGTAFGKKVNNCSHYRHRD